MRLAAILVALATLAYPAAVYFALGRVEPRWLALALMVLVLARAWAARDRLWQLVAVAALVLVGYGWLSNSGLALKLYPVLVNLSLLLVFAYSLVQPPSAIERLARLREPELPPEGVLYTRRLTQVWCSFFVINGSIALLTALAMSDAAWALYNGLIAYLLMGALFFGEMLLRPRLSGRPHG